MNLTVQKITADIKIIGIYDQYPEGYRSVQAIFLTASNWVLAEQLRAILFQRCLEKTLHFFP
jgi:hypothetical protein